MVDYRGSNAKASDEISNSERRLMPSEGGRWSVHPPICLPACLPHVLLVELSRYSFCPMHQLPRIPFWHFDGTSCYRINLLNISIQFIDWKKQSSLGVICWRWGDNRDILIENGLWLYVYIIWLASTTTFFVWKITWMIKINWSPNV